VKSQNSQRVSLAPYRAGWYRIYMTRRHAKPIRYVRYLYLYLYLMSCEPTFHIVVIVIVIVLLLLLLLLLPHLISFTTYIVLEVFGRTNQPHSTALTTPPPTNQPTTPTKIKSKYQYQIHQPTNTNTNTNPPTRHPELTKDPPKPGLIQNCRGVRR